MSAFYKPCCPCTEGAWGSCPQLTPPVTLTKGVGQLPTANTSGDADRRCGAGGYALLTFGVQSFASLHTKGYTFGVQWSIILLTNHWFVSNMMHRFAYKSWWHSHLPHAPSVQGLWFVSNMPFTEGVGQVAMRCSPLVCRALHHCTLKVTPLVCSDRSYCLQIRDL